VLESEIDASLDALELESPAAHASPATAPESAGPLATERPALATEALDTFHPPPPPGVPEAGAPEAGEHATGEALAHEEELASGELEDVEDPTGIGVNIEDALRAAGHEVPHDAHDDEIVIADDLAEDVADDARQQTVHDDEPAEEHPEAPVGVPAAPPFRAP
jgi:hypothetical protein